MATTTSSMRPALFERQEEQVVADALWIMFFFCIPFEPVRPLVWLAADAIALFIFLRSPDLFFALARKNAIFLSWGLLATASAIWSYEPNISLYHGLQLIFTILVGFLLAATAPFETVLRYLFLAGFAHAVLSVVTSLAFPEIGRFHTGDWQGIYTHKNQLGMFMLAFFIVAICLFLNGWRRMLTLAGVVLSLLLIVMSRSGSALVLLAFSLCMISLVVALRKGPTPTAITVGGLVAGLAIAFAILSELRIDLIDTVLGSMGKDRTLTGRTVLWDFATQAFYEHPILGFGYKGYWMGWGTTAPKLRFVIDQELHMFHNNFLEVAVAFGIMGPLLLGAGLLVAWWSAIRMFWSDPSYIHAWPFLYLSMIMVLCMAENPLFNNHGQAELILIVIVSATGIRGWQHPNVPGLVGDRPSLS